MWNVVHSVKITLVLFIIDYRINLLEDIDNTIPFIVETWWTHLENPMAMCFYKLHQNILLYGGNVLDKNYLCYIPKGDWKWLKFFLGWTDENNIK